MFLSRVWATLRGWRPYLSISPHLFVAFVCIIDWACRECQTPWHQRCRQQIIEKSLWCFQSWLGIMLTGNALVEKANRLQEFGIIGKICFKILKKEFFFLSWKFETNRIWQSAVFLFIYVMSQFAVSVCHGQKNMN